MNRPRNTSPQILFHATMSSSEAVYTIKESEPTIEPCGTPKSRACGFDSAVRPIKGGVFQTIAISQATQEDDQSCQTHQCIHGM